MAEQVDDVAAAYMPGGTQQRDLEVQRRAEELDRLRQDGKTLLTRRAIDFKRELKKKGLGVKDNYADEETLQILANAKKCDIIVYDNVYNEKWRLKGTSNDKRKRAAWRPPVELQLCVKSPRRRAPSRRSVFL